MNNSTAAQNILHKLLDNSIKIIYDFSDSLFDKLLLDLNIELYSENNINLLDINYDCYMSNNFLRYSTQNNYIKNFHIPSIVFIHEFLNAKFKKEDKILLNNNLHSCFKLIMHDSLSQNWDFLSNKVTTINYGFKALDIDRSKNRNDILIINTKNNHNINLIYQHIKNKYPKSMMLTDLKNKQWSEIYDIISSYKIFIDEGFIINQLIAAYCGCFIVTPTISYDRYINGSFGINDFSQLFNIIDPIIKSYNINDYNTQIDYIKSKYTFETFEKNIQNILQTIKQETFVV